MYQGHTGRPRLPQRAVAEEDRKQRRVAEFRTELGGLLPHCLIEIEAGRLLSWWEFLEALEPLCGQRHRAVIEVSMCMNQSS